MTRQREPGSAAKQRRYRQEGLGDLVPPREYDRTQPKPPAPEQGWLALDGAVLGPLFDERASHPTQENDQ